MKKHQNILFVGLILFLFISCKWNISIENSIEKSELNEAVAQIKALGEFEKVDFEFIGNPKQNSHAIIRLDLYNSSIENLDSKSMGKKCASIIFNASDKTKAFNKILVSVNSKSKGNKKKITLSDSVEVVLKESAHTRNFIFNTSDL